MTGIKEGKILIVDDNEDLLRAARMFLKRHFRCVDIEKNPEVLPGLLKSECYDVILLDMNFTQDVSSGHEGFFWLDQILSLAPSAAVVMITAYGDMRMAIQAIKAGASDFITKPWNNERLLATLHSALRLPPWRTATPENEIKNRELQESMRHKFNDIVGQSAALQRIFSTIERVATTDANVLLVGENGTGKELVARAIHRLSNRHAHPFVAVDLGSLTETLFESELFGYRKGAFTDAREDRPGRFEIAQRGTLFLDEIGNLSLPLQAKLLTVLQSRKVSRLGDATEIPLDVRILCATNLPRHERLRENRFRQDLLYRINTIEIEIPPLRERPDDIPLLATHFLHYYASRYKKGIHTISEAALARLGKHQWPGNIRELQHTLERAVILCQSQVLQPEDFTFTSGAPRETGSDPLHLDQYNLEDVEKWLIRKVLKKVNGNITQAAAELGLTRSSLYRRLEKHGL